MPEFLKRAGKDGEDEMDDHRSMVKEVEGVQNLGERQTLSCMREGFSNCVLVVVLMLVVGGVVLLLVVAVMCLGVVEVNCSGVGCFMVEGDIFELGGSFAVVVVEMENFFFLSGSSITTIHESQDCRGRGRAFL